MINMDRKLHVILTVILYLGFATCYSLILFFHKESIILPFSILTVIVILATISHVKYYRYDAVNPKAKIFIILNMVLTLIFFYFNNTNFRQIFLLILIGDCIFAFSKAFSIKYIVGTYIVYYPYIYFMHKYKYEISYLNGAIEDIVISSFCIIILFLVKSQISANVKYNELIVEREKSYQKLKEYSDKIENLAIVEERNRIALILHNSIGHSLTSIMLSLQAEKMEFVSEGLIAKESFEVVEELIQEAMSLLRKTIENADDFIQVLPFDNILDCFIRDTSNNTKVSITYDSNNTDYIKDHQRSIIFNVIVEALTNAIKHSGCNSITVRIHCSKNEVNLYITDDGCGFDDIEYGFGITKSIQSIKKLNGKYTIDSNNGCSIHVCLPIQEVN